MKKITLIGIAVAIAMGFTACQKESLSNGQTEGQLISETFTATPGQETIKTTISDDAKTVTWAAGDQIHYYTKDGGTVRDFTIEAAGSSATLTLEREKGDTYYNLVYTGSTAPVFTTKTGTSMVFDGVKPEQDGTFRNANVSVSSTTPEGSGITFKPVTALVKFTTARTDIKTIVLTGGNGEKVAGNISVDPTAASPVATLDGDGSTDITVTIATPAAGTYYINVLPGTYTNGLRLTLKNSSDAKIGTVTASKEINLSAGGKMTNLSDFDSHIIPDYFYFKANAAGSTVALNKEGTTPDVKFKTSSDGVVWTEYTAGTAMTLANSGDMLYFRADGNNTTLKEDYENYYYFSATGSVNVGGNIMYLLNGSKPEECNLGNFAFSNLFNNVSDLVSAAELTLPAATLAEYCYEFMFNGCSSLEAAPTISATTLANYCCQSMFKGCTALKNAPELPATAMQHRCYAEMFDGCISLTTTPVLLAPTLATQCYENMFDGCTSLKNAPELPAETLAESCYNAMFRGCTALETAPSLPATTLANKCYQYMFRDCAALETAPSLPAATLAESCYSYMFHGCTALKNAPSLTANILAKTCYSYMFYGCTALKNAPSLPATTLAEFCYSNMFKDCIALETAPSLPAETLQNNCYRQMFDGCTALETAPSLPATTLAESCYYKMFKGCTALKTTPSLPAETLEYECYANMFEGCISMTDAPALPATTLAGACYFKMFYGCTALQNTPTLPAATLVEECYKQMFYGCSNISVVTMKATNVSASDCLDRWLDEAGTGENTLYVNKEVTEEVKNEIADLSNGWTVKKENS